MEQQQQHHRHMRDEGPGAARPDAHAHALPQTSPSTIDLGPPPAFPRLHSTADPIRPPSALPTRFPDVPNTDLPLPLPLPRPNPAVLRHDESLPSLRTITDDVRGPPPPWHVLNPIKSCPPLAPGPLPKLESPDAMALDVVSPRATSVSLDDPDVRLAAEALGDLRADFVSSPSNTALSPTMSQHSLSQQPEPLLSLISTSHPLLATTIEGATSAYGGAKNFSPRFKSSAEYVEGYLGPIANTVTSVGRTVGVEGSVRWFLGHGRRANSSSDMEAGSSKKRRKVGSGQAAEPSASPQPSNGNGQAIMETVVLQDSTPPTPMGLRRLSLASTDTLPAYDEARSPAYTEHTGNPRDPAPNPAWQSRLIISTSGLSIAMREDSLRSLKYCLTWLRWANTHIDKVIRSLKEALEQYDRAVSQEKQDATVAEEQPVSPPGESRSELVARIDSLKGDVVKTLQDVINTISKYTGGALPENAQILVRRHLMSLPQRFRLATAKASAEKSGDNGESAMRDGAHKILVLATEGLDMVSQVSGVLDGTIVSAEEWCKRMGKKRGASKQGGDEQSPSQGEFERDVKMG